MIILNLLKLLRIHQWLKNLMLFFPPFLGGTFFTDGLVLKALLPFMAFCAASSTTYILNDIFDKKNDSHHPDKCKRPIASGQISVASALVLAAILLGFAMVSAFSIPNHFIVLLVAYLVVSFAYSARLKEYVLVDIFCISAGFLLRLQAGGAAFNIIISEWLFLSVFLLSVFLSTGKRLAEKQRLGDAAYHHRKALLAYPEGFLEGAMYLTGGAVLVTYTMYVISRSSSFLLYSVPLCCYGLYAIFSRYNQARVVTQPRR